MVAAAVAAASAHGLDSDGIVRVDDSFEDGTLNLVEESEASIALLAWEGPRIASDFIGGSEIDRVGGRCPIPAMAVRIVRPWTRIVAVTGSMDVTWREEDADLVLAALRRIRRSTDLPLIVVTPDRDRVEDRVGSLEGVEFVVADNERRAITDLLGPQDLVITSAHVVRDLPAVMGWRTTRKLQNVNLAIVAGPHRLAISRGGTGVSMQSMINAAS
jgi:hypothetical protein